MRRRDFITLLGGASAALLRPRRARAQQRPALPVIGYLHSGARDDGNGQVAAFLQGLREAGFVEGQNVAIEYRYADHRPERAAELAAELVRRPVALIVAAPNALSIGAARAATTTIPIVFMSAPDPVRTGLVASLNRPGGNLTGTTILSADLTAKRLGLLHDLVPNVSAVAMFIARAANADFQIDAALAAGRAVGLRIFSVRATDAADFEAAFARAVREGAGALMVSTDIFLLENRERLAVLAARYKLPAIYQTREYVAGGGLMSYGPSFAEVFGQMGRYAGRVLKGEKPADLPVLLPTRFEFVINLRTAKALGLDIPAGVLAIADEVIE